MIFYPSLCNKGWQFDPLRRPATPRLKSAYLTDSGKKFPFHAPSLAILT